MRLPLVFFAVTSLPIGAGFFARARGRAFAGLGNNSSGLLESVAQFHLFAPSQISEPTVLGNGTFRFTFTNANAQSFTVVATTNAAALSSAWEVLGPPVAVGGSVYQFTDSTAASHPRRFYQLRSP